MRSLSTSNTSQGFVLQRQLGNSILIVHISNLSKQPKRHVAGDYFVGNYISFILRIVVIHLLSVIFIRNFGDVKENGQIRQKSVLASERGVFGSALIGESMARPTSVTALSTIAT